MPNRTIPMTLEQLMEKLRAHGVRGRRDESPRASQKARASQKESSAQLANWESEGGSTAAPRAREK